LQIFAVETLLVSDVQKERFCPIFCDFRVIFCQKWVFRTKSDEIYAKMAEFPNKNRKFDSRRAAVSAEEVRRDFLFFTTRFAGEHGVHGADSLLFFDRRKRRKQS